MKGKHKEAAPTINQTLTFPNVMPIDYLKTCPRYTSILNRPDGDGVGIEEMDSLQMELESILVNVMQRTRNLKMETMVLDSWGNDKNDSIIIHTPQKPTNHGSTSSTTSSLSTAASEKSSLVKKIKPTLGKPTFALQNFMPAETTPIVRNDIPDIFWQSVEPYFADISEEDIKLLENQIELNHKYQTFNKMIGPLGKHYAIQWAEEDMNQQMKEGSRFVDLDGKQSPASHKRKSGIDGNEKPFKKSTSFMFDETLQNLNKVNLTQNKHETLTYGPLTQRLISALIEQNLMTPFDNELADYLEKISPPQSMYMSPKSMAKKLTFNPNSSNLSLEKKIKKTLIEQGILDNDENEKTSESLSENENATNIKKENGTQSASSNLSNSNTIEKDDEIGNEIRSLQNELKMVTSQCEQTLTQLLHTSKKKLIKQDLKKKLIVLDYEIIEAYEKCKNLRLEKKTLVKKDKEKILKLLKERDSTRNELDTFI